MSFDINVFLFKIIALLLSGHLIYKCYLQIMIPKARSDVHVNLPALQKLDSMLIVCYIVYHLTLD